MKNSAEIWRRIKLDHLTIFPSQEYSYSPLSSSLWTKNPILWIWIITVLDSTIAHSFRIGFRLKFLFGPQWWMQPNWNYSLWYFQASWLKTALSLCPIDFAKKAFRLKFTHSYQLKELNSKNLEKPIKLNLPIDIWFPGKNFFQTKSLTEKLINNFSISKFHQTFLIY
jgi:hypothetical protein